MGKPVFDFLKETGIATNKTGLRSLFSLNAKVANKLVSREGGIVA
jgi:hypothetical protein